MPKPHLSETARAGEARAAEVDMTNVTTTEMVTSRRQVTLRDAVAPQDPRDTPCRGGSGRRRHRRGGRKLLFSNCTLKLLGSEELERRQGDGVTAPRVTPRRPGSAMTHDSDRLEAFDEHLQVEIEAEDEFRPMASGRVGIKIPLRTALVAVGMLLLGLVLFSVALDFYFTHPNHDGSGPFLILGTLTLIPGSYASWTILGVYRRWPGYTLRSLPLYEEVL